MIMEDNKDNFKQDTDDDTKSTSSWSPIIKTRKRFLKEETELLEKKYSEDVNPPINEVEVLANQIGTTKKIITTWFQNRRAKEKRKRKKKAIKQNKKIKTLYNSEYNDIPQDEHTNLLYNPLPNSLLHYMAPIYSTSNIIPYQNNSATDIESSGDSKTIETITTLLTDNNQYSYLTSTPISSTLQYVPFDYMLTYDPFLFNNNLPFFDSQSNVNIEYVPSQTENSVHLNEMSSSVSFHFQC